MQEHRILEKEVKGLLPQRVYDHLYKEVAWDTKNVQVNFYYSNEYILNKLQDICIRIRCVGRELRLQIKKTIGQDCDCRESIEYEKDISNIPAVIAEEMLRGVWTHYTFGAVYLVGFLITERATKRAGNVSIMLDRNTFKNEIDYEIEFECDNAEEARLVIKELGLDGKLILSCGKYERFCKTLSSHFEHEALK